MILKYLRSWRTQKRLEVTTKWWKKKYKAKAKIQVTALRYLLGLFALGKAQRLICSTHELSRMRETDGGLFAAHSSETPSCQSRFFYYTPAVHAEPQAVPLQLVSVRSNHRPGKRCALERWHWLLSVTAQYPLSQLASFQTQIWALHNICSVLKSRLMWVYF